MEIQGEMPSGGVHGFFGYLLAALITCFVAACGGLSSGQRIDNIPMYGQPDIQRPEILKKADESFIKKATEQWGTREKASRAWSAQGDKYMNNGNLDYAMRRYNQSWLLNPNNFQPYWGFARVLLPKGRLDEGIDYLERAEKLIVDEYQKVALLSDIGAAYSLKADDTPKENTKERTGYFELANKNFQQSVNLDPSYSNVWFFWSRSLFFEKRYEEAWEKLLKAQSLGVNIPTPFLKALQEKLSNAKKS